MTQMILPGMEIRKEKLEKAFMLLSTIEDEIKRRGVGVNINNVVHEIKSTLDVFAEGLQELSVETPAPLSPLVNAVADVGAQFWMTAFELAAGNEENGCDTCGDWADIALAEFYARFPEYYKERVGGV